LLRTIVEHICRNADPPPSGHCVLLRFARDAFGLREIPC
jgi:hypothetical protein